MRRRRLRSGLGAVAILAGASYLSSASGSTPVRAQAAMGNGAGKDTSAAALLTTTTPIKHVVVLFQENVSFDHYFATYPNATNSANEPAFIASPNTPSVNGLSGPLLTHNPNSVQPFRLDRTQALTCDQNHDYTAEQKAFDNGLMDKFVENTEGSAYNKAQYCPAGTTMGYFDGNTVTALWNYAQNYAMSDNSYGMVFGPSTPGALALTVGETAGTACGPSSAVFGAGACPAGSPAPAASVGTGTVYSDADPYYDDCSKGGTTDKSKTIAQTGKNAGDLLNAKGITWGWFQGGFDDCAAKHVDVVYDQSVGINPATDPNTTGDYNPHHQPFQYFAQTSNPHHLRPSSIAAIGQTDQANHQYDMNDFWAAADAGNLPAVAFLKAPNYQDGHAGYSNPLDEQNYIVTTINHLERLPSWNSTAVIINYDDSDGWYDHVMGPIVSHSNTKLDVNCGSSSTGPAARCGYGPRLPYIVISPWARTNYVDHTLTDQSSTLRFIEDNWLGGQRTGATSFDNLAGFITGMFDFKQAVVNGHSLTLDPTTGATVAASSAGRSSPYFAVSFASTKPGQGSVNFGTSCSALVQTATSDAGAGTTTHTITVTGNDLAGTVGNIGITPGYTYYYETVTTTASGPEIDSNHGRCYQAIIPAG